MNRKYLSGKRFGKLVVMNELHERKNGNVQWCCKCDCGNTAVVITTSLLTGRTQSCGCLVKEINSKKAATGNSRRTHGMNGTNIYYVWVQMKQRCNNPKHKQFKDWGGRGITVCDEWKESFQAFYDYVSQLPHFGEKGYSLDRINNDGNYEPGNVRWATAKEQNMNQRRTKHGIENE